MNKSLFVIFCLFIPGIVTAQIRYQQLTLGGGAGVATAYTSTDLPQTNAAFYADATYYPVSVFALNLEARFGSFGGAAIPGNINFKRFSSNYKSAMLEAQVFLGIFYNAGGNGFLTFIRNSYAGVGYGKILSTIDNIDLATRTTTDRVSNNLGVIPITIGYEFNLLNNKYNEPILKINISSGFYYTTSIGLDGYYDNNVKANGYYTYYAVGLKYTFVIHGTYGHSYNKFD